MNQIMRFIPALALVVLFGATSASAMSMVQPNYYYGDQYYGGYDYGYQSYGGYDYGYGGYDYGYGGGGYDYGYGGYDYGYGNSYYPQNSYYQQQYYYPQHYQQQYSQQYYYPQQQYQYYYPIQYGPQPATQYTGQGQAFGMSFSLCAYPGYGNVMCGTDPRQPVHDYWTGRWY